MEETNFGRDLAIYAEDHKNQKIVSNRIRILAQKESKRKINHKDALAHEVSFDPMRMKLRIIPIQRAPKTSGKTPDYYFIEASKFSLRNDLS